MSAGWILPRLGKKEASDSWQCEKGSFSAHGFEFTEYIQYPSKKWEGTNCVKEGSRDSWAWTKRQHQEKTASDSGWRFPSVGDRGTYLLIRHTVSDLLLDGGANTGCCRETAEACPALGLLPLAAHPRGQQWYCKGWPWMYQECLQSSGDKGKRHGAQVVFSLILPVRGESTARSRCIQQVNTCLQRSLLTNSILWCIMGELWEIPFWLWENEVYKRIKRI